MTVHMHVEGTRVSVQGQMGATPTILPGLLLNILNGSFNRYLGFRIVLRPLPPWATAIVATNANSTGTPMRNEFHCFIVPPKFFPARSDG